MQQYPFPRPVSSESMFSFQLSGLCLVTFINLAPPIAVLHHGLTAGSDESCLITTKKKDKKRKKKKRRRIKTTMITRFLYVSGQVFVKNSTNRQILISAKDY